MKRAIELAAEIERKKAAIHKTKSEYLRRDYGKSIKRSMAELKYYCRSRGIDYDEVIRSAEHDLY